MGIALSDTLCVLTPSLFLAYLYAFLRSPDEPPYLPFYLCRVWDYIIKNTTLVTHTTSVWLTVCLAVHRYVCVCHPFAVKRYFTRKKTMYMMVAICVTSVTMHLCRFIDTEYQRVPIGVFKSTNESLAEKQLEKMTSNSTVFTCTAVHAHWLQGYEVVYETIYYWIYITLVICCPCLCLSVLSILMMRNLRRSDAVTLRNVCENQAHQGTEEKYRRRNRRRMTKLIVCIIAMVTIVELPLGITLILWTVTMLHHSVFIGEDVLGSVSILLNLVVYFSYPMIFMLYCLMSTRFRMAVKALCSRERFHHRPIHSETSAEMAILTRGQDSPGEALSCQE